MQLKQGIDQGTQAIVEHIRSQAIPVEGKKEIAQIASISAAGETIGDLIAEVMDKVGKDGVITVEESKGINFETEYVEGMQSELKRQGHPGTSVTSDPSMAASFTAFEI